MQEDPTYLVPDYYPGFRCKQGACRTPCCEGWPISVTMQDYFRLLSVPCSADLRRRLDGAMHLCNHATPERYALISPRWDGKCPLHQPDGRCQLHAELGEEVLSAVCRLYPRGVRTGEDREASCANSCEAVVEMLLDRQAPLQFIRQPVQHCLPDAPPPSHFFHTAGRGQEIRLWLIRQLQRREYPLPQRMLLLGEALMAADHALTAHDDARLDALLTGREALHVPEAIVAGHDQLIAGLDAAEQMLAIIDRQSRSVHDYGEAALAYFGQGEAAFTRYTAAAEQFVRLVPEWETWFEHLLINHMFFAQFPFQDRPVPLKDEYLALCAVYVLLRFLCLGWTAEHPSREAAVDVCAAAFRLVDHTDFDRFAAPILRQLGCDDRAHLRQLLCL
ncbi:MAG: flagellin lysine-N-methylase [Clostridia bacterium]|nr:flagellin lysine-N-methylase [Clostridia bacterium]